MRDCNAGSPNGQHEYPPDLRYKTRIILRFCDEYLKHKQPEIPAREPGKYGRKKESSLGRGNSVWLVGSPGSSGRKPPSEETITLTDPACLV